MQHKKSHTSLVVIIGLFILSLFPIILMCNYSLYLSDDAYITLTYSKNIALGYGFVFNHPPAILGTTTPLLALIVAFLGWIFSPAYIPQTAIILTTLCWLGCMWLFYIFRKEWGLEEWQTIVLGGVIIGSGWISLLGMEAYLFAFLLILSQSLFLSKRFVWTGFVIGLLFLTRGEGILVFGVTSLAVMLNQWQKGKLFDIQFMQIILKISIGFAIPVLIWFLYAQVTFGSVLPNTLGAKQAQGQTTLWNSFLQRLIKEWISLWGKDFTVFGVSYINIWWITICIGLFGVFRNHRQWLMFVGWISTYILGYVSLHVAGYWWYQLPILFVLQLLFGLGIIDLVTWLLDRVKPLYLAYGVSVFLVGVLMWFLAKPTFQTALTYKGDMRGESYIALSQWFRENTESTDSVAFIEIGYLGYYTDNRIIDLAGLILPDVVPHIAEKDFSWGFWHYEPEYYVYLSDFDWALADIRSNPRFEREYQSVAVLPGPRETDFVIYKRIDQ